jgi:hypothetical protein
MLSGMPVRHVIDLKHHLVITVGEGPVTIDEIKAHRDRLLCNPDFDPSFNELIDLTTMTKAEMSVNDLMDLARSSIFSPASQRAIVAVKPEVFGMGRVYEAVHAERSQIRVFYDRNEALTWLRVERDSGLF